MTKLLGREGNLTRPEGAARPNKISFIVLATVILALLGLWTNKLTRESPLSELEICKIKLYMTRGQIDQLLRSYQHGTDSSCENWTTIMYCGKDKNNPIVVNYFNSDHGAIAMTISGISLSQNRRVVLRAGDSVDRADELLGRRMLLIERHVENSKQAQDYYYERNNCVVTFVNGKVRRIVLTSPDGLSRLYGPTR